MKKGKPDSPERELASEYDFSRGVRGKYAARFAEGTNLAKGGSGQPVWIHIDEHDEAVGALEAFERFASRVRQDSFEWRWAILSLHTALQGFMVVAIRDTAGMFPLSSDVAAAWMAAYQSGQPRPRERLDSFLNLYRKIKRPEIASFLRGHRFVPARTQGRSVRLLNRIRNQFIHFVPGSWALEGTGLPAVCLDCLAIIRYLAHDYRENVWTASQLDRIDAALLGATATLDELRGEYESQAV